MDGWRKLKHNPLARLGGLLLLVFYLVVIGADFVAPYDPYAAQPKGSLLPPTQIHWQNQQGEFVWPYVYPTQQGPVRLETGERQLRVDREQPARLTLFARGSTYQLFQLKLPLPPDFRQVEIWPGIECDRHLFGTRGPAKFNLLGTDEQGRDQFSRLVHGGRISLSIGLVGIAVSFPLGMLIGGLSGYFGGWLDAALMRLVEVLMAIPSLYLLVALSAVLPPGLSSAQQFLLIVVILSLVNWPGLARVIRGQTLSLKEREFVEASRAMGASSFYTIARQILPQTVTYAIIQATLAVPSFIVAESILSLIGLGIQQPDPSWGNMLSLATNASVVVLQPWLIWPPALLIVLTVWAFNLLGDGLRDALDPRTLQ